MEKMPASNTRQLPPAARFVLAGIALGLSYVALSQAIDSGSLLLYAATVILFVLGIKDVVAGIRAFRKGVR